MARRKEGSQASTAAPSRPLVDGPRDTGRRLRGAVAQYLGSAIVSGRIAQGSLLTGEVANAEALNVSRSAYREAVQVLASKGLVEGKPRAGTRVLPRSRWNLLDPMVLAWAFTGEPDVEFVRDLFELRAVVEPAIARFAAERRSEEDIARLQKALEDMQRHTLVTEAGRAADRDFHEALLEAARNDVMMALSASISAAVQWTTTYKLRGRSLPRDPVPDHASVCEAVAAGNADAAAAAMQALVDLAHQDTREAIAGARQD